MITTETRSHLMAARNDVFRAGDGHANVDLALVAAHIDRALRALCPHLPVTWNIRPDAHGRKLTTCYACGMDWYDHGDDLAEAANAISHERETYMALLEKRLQERSLAHGFAYVTSREGERLQTYGVYQPGHTVHRFSSISEDRSDAALEAREIEADPEEDVAPSASVVNDLGAGRSLLRVPDGWSNGKHRQ